MIRAVLWDFGGVILSSPFEAFNDHEQRAGLPTDFIRSINARDPHANAWARLERNEISPSEFDELFRQEAISAGHDVRGATVLGLLAGEVRSEMVRALDLVRAAGYKTACLTNNVVSPVATDCVRAAEIDGIMARFDAILESSKVGCRKPEPRFYELACAALDVEASECVFLDDLGINLKPAAAMGMRTIKVLSAPAALDELESVLGLSLR